MTMAFPRDSSLTQEDNEHCLNTKKRFQNRQNKTTTNQKNKILKMGAGEFNKTQLQQEPVKKHG